MKTRESRTFGGSCLRCAAMLSWIVWTAEPCSSRYPPGTQPSCRCDLQHVVLGQHRRELGLRPLVVQDRNCRMRSELWAREEALVGQSPDGRR